MRLLVILGLPVSWSEKKLMLLTFSNENEAGLKKHMYSRIEVILKGKVFLG